MHFNSHPHEEDDLEKCDKSMSVRISTHILTKRMTYNHFLNKNKKKISTHILTKRMTVTGYTDLLTDFYFNSHPHEEDDNNFLNLI